MAMTPERSLSRVRRLIGLAVACAGLLVGMPPGGADDSAGPRTWTSTDGRSLVATLRTASETEVQLLRSDGLSFTLPHRIKNLFGYFTRDRVVGNPDEQKGQTLKINRGIRNLQTCLIQGGGQFACHPVGAQSCFTA